MTSIKCPQCGLVYWTTNENCRRCGLATADAQQSQQMDQPQAYAPTAPAQPFQSDSFDEEHLLKNLNRDCKRFYFIGGLQIGLWLFVGNLLIIDGFFNIGLSFLAHKFKSRVASIFLLLLTVLSVLAALAAIGAGSLRATPLTAIVLIGRLAIGIRLVYTTFKLNAHAHVDVTLMMPPLPPVFHNEEAPQWSPPVGAAQWQPE
jgi:hypothetical protein